MVTPNSVPWLWQSAASPNLSPISVHVMFVLGWDSFLSEHCSFTLSLPFHYPSSYTLLLPGGRPAEDCCRSTCGKYWRCGWQETSVSTWRANALHCSALCCSFVVDIVGLILVSVCNNQTQPQALYSTRNHIWAFLLAPRASYQRLSASSILQNA